MSHTLFIIFGSTGDLAKRKLFPAIYEIFKKNQEGSLSVLAIGRKMFSGDAFRAYIDSETDSFMKKGTDFEAYLGLINYQQVEVSKEDDYTSLSDTIRELSHPETQVVIYLSIAPDLFTDFIRHYSMLNLGESTKIVFEKPFGTDLFSSRELNNEIRKVFLENQIYRIDHYVGKESIQNIFSFRFANSLFEPIWNNQYIDNIQITASESLDVGSRGGYYDASGALRDMVQNHLFQVLSLVMMDAPEYMSDEMIREKKLAVFQDLELDDDFAQSVVFGQYEGYTETSGVASDSRTETFVALKLEVASTRWKGVPIYLKTGKSLDKKLTQIVIEFRKVPYDFFDSDNSVERNRIIIDIQPDETIRIEFNVKEIGNSKQLRKVEGVFENDTHGKEAYEKLIEDITAGDKTLFTSFEMLEETWRIIDRLVHCKDNCPVLYQYKKGSSGPEIANSLIQNDGRKWYRVQE